MNAETPRASAAPLKDASNSGLVRSLRILTFPLLTNLWPLLLFVSQKVFVIPALVLAGVGDQAYRRDLIFAALASACGLLVYMLQSPSSYDLVHLVGYLFFVWSMPLINYAVRYDSWELLRLLTYLTMFNAIMGFFLMVTDIDLYGLRGLNRIVGSDALTHRVYFESASLTAVILLETFRTKWLRIAALMLAVAFLLFVTRSVAVILLLGLNLLMPYVMRSTLGIKLAISIVAIVIFSVLYSYLPVLRPDVDLSLRVKQFQLDLIWNALNNNHWSGWGWGAVYPQLASDPEQPYQIEMQLPMLLLQVGPLAVVAIFGLIGALFLSATKYSWFGVARFVIYLMIGFNNPWLFIPSWFLTCQLLFRYDDEEGR